MPRKEIYWKNPEKYRQLKNEWRKNNELHVANYSMMWRMKNRKQGDYNNKHVKKHLIAGWKNKKMKIDSDMTFDDIYEIYQNTKECFWCGISFENRKKNLDHDHKEGHVRGVICSSCNKKDVLAGLI